MALVLDGNGTMTLGNGGITGLNVAAIPASKIATGALLQAKQNTSSTQIASNTAEVAIDIGVALNDGITPTASSSKFKVSVTAYLSGNYVNMSMSLTLQRKIGSGGTWTDIGVGSGSGGINVTSWWNKTSAVTDPADLWQCSIVYLDTPSTTDTVYYRVMGRGYGGYFYVNRNYRNSHATYDRNPLSTILVEEIAG